MKNHPCLSSSSALLTLVLVAFGAATAHARAPIRTAFFNVYSNATGSKLDSLSTKPGHCGVCHFDFNGGGPRNPYGAAVEARYESNGKNATEAIQYVRSQNLDDDGDGFSTNTEVTNTVTYANTPTFPGLKVSNTSSIVNLTAAQLAELAGYLTPVIGGDTTPPSVTLITPNGGQTITANLATNVAWSASDTSGIAGINLFLSTNNGTSWQQIARDLIGVTNYSWVPADRPTAQALIRVVATDTYGNSNSDSSDGVFTIVSLTDIALVGTTLRDLDLPGTQPFEHGPELAASSDCAACHGNYDTAKEPYFNWRGSMMANASRDLLFLANMAIANQDAANSGDLCLRCHLPRGWLGGRSVPTDGSRMLPADGDGVTCALCHGMTDPVYQAGVSPTNDLAVLAALSFKGTNYGNGMYVVDPTGTRRGPYSDATMGHTSLGSSFHRSAAFCGTCHDVSNPVFTKDTNGVYQVNDIDAAAPDFSPHFIAPVERTFSEWLASDYNTTNGVYAPAFAGNRPDGRVSTCQHCHMRSTSGYVASTNVNPGIPLRTDMAIHDMTGGSTWMPAMLTNLFPAEVNQPAIQAGIERATYLLQNAASLSVGDITNSLKVTVTNECGHKLPTGYPEGRRVWLNVQFYDAANNLLAESGAYNTNTGVLTQEAAKIYAVHPGIDTNISGALGFPADASLHFVLNNKIYEDNRIPPRGFTNAAFALFGGEPVGHHYDDGQYWDETQYTLPAGATRAEVKLYYQSTSKEFVEFLRDENHSNTNGQALYDLWNNNGKCPPTLMAEATWVLAFQLQQVEFNGEGDLEFHFLSRPGTTYKIEYTDSLNGTPVWHDFSHNGTLVATETSSEFRDDFTVATSGGPSATGARFYRFSYSLP